MGFYLFKEKTFLIAFVTLSCLYFMPMEELFISLAGILILEIILHRNRFKVSLFSGFGIYIWFLLSGMAIGIYCILFHGYTPRAVLKDMIYVLFPLMFWLLGKNITLQKKTILTGLFLSGVMVSFCDFVTGLFQILQNGVSGLSLYQFRRIVGAGHPLTIITLFIYLFLPRNIFLKKKQAYVCIGILLVDLLFHFSRITFLNASVFLLYLGIFKRPKKVFWYGFLIAAGLAGAYMAFSSVFENFVERLSNSLTEISHIRESWDHVAVVTNWRGYEVYCELEKFQSANIREQIFGGGFGTQLDVKGKAYLVTTEETLPFLHNGYFSILMIWGVFGCAVYLFMLLMLYQQNRRLPEKERKFWKALVAVLAVDTLFVHGLFFSSGMAGIFFYLGILDNLKKGAAEDGQRTGTTA